MTHRDLKPVPALSDERQKLVNWLLIHKIWHYPVTTKVPPGEDMTKLLDGSEPDETWVDFTFDEGGLQECAWFEFVYVDPETETIEDDVSRNTAFRVWIEAGPWHDMWEDPVDGGLIKDRDERWVSGHDPCLDCGASDMETALLELARRVELFYDEEGNSRGIRWCGLKDKSPACTYDENDFCTKCGFEREEEI